MNLKICSKDACRYYNVILLGIMALCVLIFFEPNMKTGIIAGSDSPFHMARIESLALAIQRGEFPVKMHMDLAYGYGYGVGFFYSNFFLYFPAILMCFGVDIEVAYEIFALAVDIGTIAGMYLAIYKLTRRRYLSVACGILYLFSTVVEESMYVHFALGRSTALIFLPLAIVGIYIWAYRDENAHMFAIGFIGLIFSHVLSTVLATIVCGMIAALYSYKWINKIQKWKQMLYACALVLIITACYWMPLLQQWMAQTYRASEPWAWVDEYVMPFSSLFTWNSIGIVLSYVGVLTGILLLVSLWKHLTVKGIVGIYILGVLLTILPCISVFWEKTRIILKFLQYPSRVLAPATILIIMAFAMETNGIELINCRASIKKVMRVLIALFCLSSVLLGWKDINNNEEFRTDYKGRQPHLEIAGLGAGEEWLPLETERECLGDPGIAYDDKKNAIRGNKTESNFELLTDGSQYYDIPYIWYVGYRAVDVNSGTAYKIEKNQENGMVRVITNGISDTLIRVWYKGTKLQALSYIISLIGVVWVLLRGCFYLKHRISQ